jgi:hypothetical protein
MMRQNTSKLFIFIILTVIFISLFSIDCATIIHGNKQVVPVSSNPTGAQVTVNGQLYYNTPCELLLEREKPAIVTLTLEGYQTEQVKLEKGFSIWFFVGIVPGLIVPGPVTDLVSGSAYQLTPESVTVNLKKVKKK